MIRAKGLDKTYDKGTRHENRVLRGIDLELPDTGFVCILGVSGCGKTSLLNVLGGIDTFDGGRISVNDTEADRYGTRRMEAERNRSFAYIFQNYYLLSEHSVAYNVYLGMQSLSLSEEEKRARIREALAAVDLSHYGHRTVDSLSGGQKQRVAIARALVRRPRVIFADEPTGNLDEANTQKICAILRRLSENSLVLMVTHEERIARFYADRILRLDGGKITEDSTEFSRTPLLSADTDSLYTADYAESVAESETFSVRVLTEENAPPLRLTVVAAKDRILIKVDDARTFSAVKESDTPVIREGARPVLLFPTEEEPGKKGSFAFLPTGHEKEKAEEPPKESPTRKKAKKQNRAGDGLPFSLLLREARFLSQDRGMRRGTRVGLRIFLILLTLLTVLTVSDFLTLAGVNSGISVPYNTHLTEIRAEYTEKFTSSPLFVPETEMQSTYLAALRETGVDFDALPPHAPSTLGYTTDLFAQFESYPLTLADSTYLPHERLRADTLIAGRMPTSETEIVLERAVIERTRNSERKFRSLITENEYFLDRTLTTPWNNCTFRVVGIADTGEMSVYMHRDMISSTANASTRIIRESALRNLGVKLPDTPLNDDSCYLIGENADTSFLTPEFRYYRLNKDMTMYVQEVLWDVDTYAVAVLSDAAADRFAASLLGLRFYLYAPDKEALKAATETLSLPAAFTSNLKVSVKDPYADAMRAHVALTTGRADARTVITFTVLFLSAVFLWFLCRSVIHGRIGMIAVYRLLGIPRGKTCAVFAAETLALSCRYVLPTALLTYGAIRLAEGLVPDLPLTLSPPFAAVVIAFCALCLFHLAAILLPALRLLGKPPARLAVSYDL